MINESIVLQPIGRIHSPFKHAVGMPIQTIAAQQHEGKIEVFAPFAAGLRDVQEFQYLILLTSSHGVFATRAPARPNRIGLSIVELLGMDGCWLHFRGNDMLDGTPVLDIKPYVPQLDVRETERIGWFARGLDQLPGRLSDERMR